MIKAKPRKRNEVKINEKQEIKITRQPTEEMLNECKLSLILLNLSNICKNHKAIWDNELKNNDGIVPFEQYMRICKVRAGADRIFENNFDNDEVGEDLKGNLFYQDILIKQTYKSLTGIGEKPLVTIDDKIQRLPDGFMGTLGSWNRMTKDLFKLRNKFKNLEIEKEILKILNMSDKYFTWVYENIIFKDVL